MALSRDLTQLAQLRIVLNGSPSPYAPSMLTIHAPFIIPH